MKFGEKNIFIGDRKRQITSEYYYGGGGELFPVVCLKTANNAIDEIVDQGEGIKEGQGIFDGDHVRYGQEPHPAHYYRFKEIKMKQLYRFGDTDPNAPSGSKIKVNYSAEAVYPVKSNLTTKDYSRYPELKEKSDEFNRSFMQLLDSLNDTFNGAPDQLIPAVHLMYKLKYATVALMKTPLGKTEYHAGPTWEYIG